MKQSWRLDLIATLVLTAVVLALFLPSLSGEFIWDDILLIKENAQLRSANFLRDVFRTAFGGGQGSDSSSHDLDHVGQFYRPLTSFTYWTDLQVWGNNSGGFHLTNLLLQVMNSLLLYFILIRIGTGFFPALSAGLLFTVFPLHFENVSWISGRTDLLSFLFAGLSFLFFLKHLERKKVLSLWVSALLFGASLLAKENTLFLPAVFFLILWRRDSKFWPALRQMIPFALAGSLWFGLRWAALSGGSFPLSGRTLADFFSALGFYIWKTVVPFHLSFSVDGGRVFGRVDYTILGVASALILMVCLALLLSRKTRGGLFPLAFASFVLLLLPSLLVIFSATTVSFLGWRFLYLPSAVALGYFAFILWRKIPFKAASAGVCIILVLLFSAEIYPKNRHFGLSKDDFWMTIKNPDRENPLFRYNIAGHCLVRNEPKALSIFEGILADTDHFLHGVHAPRIYEELAEHYTRLKKPTEAEKYFNILLRERQYQSQHFFLVYARHLAQKGKVEEGRIIIERMLRTYPENHLVMLYSAIFYHEIGEFDEAMEILTKDYALFSTDRVRGLMDQLRKEMKNRDLTH